MSALQWALLILSVAIVIAIVVISRRERKPLPRWEAPTPPPAEAREPASEQMDIFQAPRAAPPPESREPEFQPRPVERAVDPVIAAPVVPPTVVGSPLSSTPLQFDEFGVGKPRKRTAPHIEPTLSAPAEPSGGFDAPAAEPAPARPEPPPPAFLRAPAAPRSPEPRVAEPAPAPAKPAPKVADKIVALLIAEREGTAIMGARLHQALAAQGLVYGAKQIYHRLSGGEPVFSVASLVKPGVLVPAEAAGFSTPGLSVFMVLPGPLKPAAALQDMLSTAQALARALNAEVYDGRKQPLTGESMRELQRDVEDWARAAKL